jgi:hypothetical protein
MDEVALMSVVVTTGAMLLYFTASSIPKVISKTIVVSVAETVKLPFLIGGELLAMSRDVVVGLSTELAKSMSSSSGGYSNIETSPEDDRKIKKRLVQFEHDLNTIGTTENVAHQFHQVMKNDLACYDEHYTSLNTCPWLYDEQVLNLKNAHLSVHSDKDTVLKILRAYYVLTRRDLAADINVYLTNAKYTK